MATYEVEITIRLMKTMTVIIPDSVTEDDAEEWVRRFPNSCQAAGVPFFFKKLGDYKGRGDWLIPAGREVDGREWEEFPPIPKATIKLLIQYPTKERKWLSKTTYQNIYREVELSPVRVLRFPCGTGAAANRYHYQADFPAPEDAAFSHGGLIRTNIERKWNPHFKPKKLEWDGDICNSPCV